MIHVCSLEFVSPNHDVVDSCDPGSAQSGSCCGIPEVLCLAVQGHSVTSYTYPGGHRIRSAKQRLTETDVRVSLAGRKMERVTGTATNLPCAR